MPGLFTLLTPLPCLTPTSALPAAWALDGLDPLHLEGHPDLSTDPLALDPPTLGSLTLDSLNGTLDPLDPLNASDPLGASRVLKGPHALRQALTSPQAAPTVGGWTAGAQRW